MWWQKMSHSCRQSFRINTWEVNCDDPINVLSLRFCAHLSLNSRWHWTSNETYLQEVMVLCHVSLIWFCWEWKSDTSMYSSSIPTETYLIHIWQLLTWFPQTWFPQKQNWQSKTSSHLQDEVPQQALFNTYQQCYFQFAFLSQFPLAIKKKKKTVMNMLWFLLPTKVKATFLCVTSLELDVEYDKVISQPW